MTLRSFIPHAILCAFLLATSFSRADESAFCEGKTLKAIFPAADPFAEVVRMPVGAWKNQIVDTSIKRPAKILSEESNKIVFANFRDGEAFHQAKINLDGIEDIYFRINRFPSIPGITPAHTLFYIKMKPGSEIVVGAEKNAADFANSSRVSEFVMSMDYLAPKGEKYNLLKSAKPNYLSVIDFRSAKDYQSHEDPLVYSVEYLKLQLSDEEKGKLVRAGLHQSNSDGASEAYHLVSHNCTTVAFDLLDRAVDYPLPVQRFQLSAKDLRDPTAGPSEKALLARGLIRDTDRGRIPKIWSGKDGFLPKTQKPSAPEFLKSMSPSDLR